MENQVPTHQSEEKNMNNPSLIFEDDKGKQIQSEAEP